MDKRRLREQQRAAARLVWWATTWPEAWAAAVERELPDFVEKELKETPRLYGELGIAPLDNLPAAIDFALGTSERRAWWEGRFLKAQEGRAGFLRPRRRTFK